MVNSHIVNKVCAPANNIWLEKAGSPPPVQISGAHFNKIGGRKIGGDYMSEIKRMDIKEFREMGLLAELNRAFLHPLGLAIEVIVEDDGTEKLGGIWDYRDDPEGMLYSKECFPTEKIKKAQEFIRQKHEQRLKVLGFIYQDPDSPQ
jgi:hypothetical protein